MIEQNPINLVQTLGNEQYIPGQHLNCFQYNKDGKHFALGDESGLLHIFQDIDNQWTPVSNFRAHQQSHDQQKNQAIECRVSILRWLDSTLSSLKILTTNYRFIKIWRLKDTDIMQVQYNHEVVPTLIPTGHSTYRQNLLMDYRYTNQITHLDLSSSDEYALTATRSIAGNSIQKWSLQKINKSIILWQKKREQPIMEIMEGQTEMWGKLQMIGSLKFHLARDNCYAFSTKYGDIKYIDSRYSCTNIDNVDSKPNVINMKFTPYTSPGFINSPHTKYLQAIGDFQFLEDYNTLVARDYFNLYIWDLRKPSTPIKFFPVFSQVNKRVLELIFQNRLDDRFKLNVKGNKVITSFYSNTFHLIDLETDQNTRVTVQTGQNQRVNKELLLEKCPNQYKPRELNFHPCKKEIGVTYQNRMDIYNYI